MNVPEPRPAPPAAPGAPHPSAARQASAVLDPFATYLDGFRAAVAALPPEHAVPSGGIGDVLAALAPAGPLAAFVPEAYGGRGGHPAETLAVLDAAGYGHGLALTLAVGITGALFVGPLARHGAPGARARVLPRFAAGRALGGLMITEPGHGTDALGMRTAFDRAPEGGYRIRGTKHWAGLTGLADHWLVTARERLPDGGLGRDVRTFLCEPADGQRPAVEARYDALGLGPIPYGRSRLDLRVPEDHLLGADGAGLRVLMGTLVRSRLAFAGMAVGVLRRLAGDALAHARARHVGGAPLLAYDQVRARVAAVQAASTVAAALCVHTATAPDAEPGALLFAANATKALLTDGMSEAADHLLQLTGAAGYRRSHRAGRALVDARPFRIFEGSNDVLYAQVADALGKAARRAGARSLRPALAALPETAPGAGPLGLDVPLDPAAPQRHAVALGGIAARAFALGQVLRLGAAGFNPALVAAAAAHLRGEAGRLAADYTSRDRPAVVDEPDDAAAWSDALGRAPARAA